MLMKNPGYAHRGKSGERHLRTFLAVLSVLLLLGCHSNERKQAFSAEDYLAQRDDISEELRAAIINRKVAVGMFPDKAHAAAGAFIYNVKPDPKWGDGYDPPDIISGQRHSLNNSSTWMKALLLAAEQPDAEINKKNHISSMLTQGRDDSNPSAALCGARSMLYSFAPPALHPGRTCRVNYPG